MDVEDWAFGLIKMEDGATNFLRSAWALNTTDVREAKVSLFGTEGGVEMKQGPRCDTGLVVNRVEFGKLAEIRPQMGGGVAYVGPGAEDSGTREARQWLQSIVDDTEPLVKPEQAFVVTQILEAVYKSAELGKAIEL